MHKLIGAFAGAAALSVIAAAPAFAASTNAEQVVHGTYTAGQANVLDFNGTVVSIARARYTTVYNPITGAYKETFHGQLSKSLPWPTTAVTVGSSTSSQTWWFDGDPHAPGATSWTEIVTPSGQVNVTAYYNPTPGSQP